MDQRGHGGGVARRAQHPREHARGGVPVLDPDRGVRGHADDLDHRQRVGLHQVGLAGPQQRSARRVAQSDLALADHRGGQQLDRRLGARGQRPRAFGAGDHGLEVAGHHVRDRGLEEHRGSAARVARHGRARPRAPAARGPRPVSPGATRHARACVRHRPPASGSDVRPDASSKSPVAREASPQRTASPAAANSRAARGSTAGVSCAARVRSRIAVACAPRPRASSAAASKAAATASSGATAQAARCHARSAPSVAAASAACASRRATAEAPW